MYRFKFIDRELFSKLSALPAAPGSRECAAYRSLAITQALMRSDCTALAVCFEGEPVGYLEYSTCPETGCRTLHTLLVAEGPHEEPCRKAALEYLVQQALADEDCRHMEAWADGDEAAALSELGFAYTNRRRGRLREMTLTWTPASRRAPTGQKTARGRVKKGAW